MASVNSVTILGRLGKDPETRHMADGGAVTSFSAATTSTWKDKAGEKQVATEWHKIVIFGKLAEVAEEYLKKGSLVYLEGSLKTRKWQGKDGKDNYTTEIIANVMQMLDGKPTDKPAAVKPSKPAGGSFADMEDDLAF